MYRIVGNCCNEYLLTTLHKIREVCITWATAPAMGLRSQPAARRGDMSMIVRGTLAPFGAIMVELDKAVAFKLAAEKRADARVRETKWMFVNRLNNRMKPSAKSTLMVAGSISLRSGACWLPVRRSHGGNRDAS